MNRDALQVFVRGFQTPENGEDEEYTATTDAWAGRSCALALPGTQEPDLTTGTQF